MLKGILAIAGQGGLFKMVAEAQNSIIVESLTTGKRMPAYATSKISALEDIAVFTNDEEMALKDVFKQISEKENGEQAISHKASSNEIKKYFGEVLPDYDEDRVYVSDMKKIIQWYNLLQERELLNFDEKKSDNQETTEEAK